MESEKNHLIFQIIKMKLRLYYENRILSDNYTNEDVARERECIFQKNRPH
jgi:hypothetical protein